MKKINGVWYVTYVGGCVVGFTGGVLMVISVILQQYAPLISLSLGYAGIFLATVCALIIFLVLDPIPTLDNSLIGQYEGRKRAQAKAAKAWQNRQNRGE